MKYDFVDVIVTYITGYGYTVVVTTSANILKVMNDNSVNFINLKCQTVDSTIYRTGGKRIRLK